MKILIVDDHVLFREGLASLIGGQTDIQVVGEASSVQEAIAMATDLKPDLVLMDYTMPDGSGVDAAKAILRILPNTNILFLTVHEDDELLFEAVRSGAKGYLLKNVPVTQLLKYIRGVERGEAALTPSMTGKILNEFARMADSPKRGNAELDVLSPREMEVLEQLSRGASNNEIANRLVISENTVKNHIHSILTKLNLQNRVQASKYLKNRIPTKN
ncbi:MAG: response regulator transcription factor [Caldilineaceae bacterium]